MAFPAEKQLRLDSENGEDEEKTCLYAMQLASLSVLPMTLKAAIELGLFELIAAVKPPQGYLSAGEIAALLRTTNPHAPAMIDRILCLLASYSILAFSDSHDSEGRLVRRYGAAPVSKYFTSGEGNSSLAAFTRMHQDRVLMESCHFLKDSVMNGGIPFTLAYGSLPFEFLSKDQRFGGLFNEAMEGHSFVIMYKILEKYEGLDNVKNIVDVGGGTGRTLHMIRKRHPHIIGINFDLPHVISEATPLEGITHVAGDMFESIPAGEAMLIKWILHDWSDDHCLNILKNCWKSLPNKGKILIIESILPNAPKTTPESQKVYLHDIIMLAHTEGGKERTEKEFETLALQSGFSEFKVAFGYANYWVMEITK